MPGFKLTEEDKRHVPKHFECLRCLFVLREPMQLCCGHHACTTCLDEWKQESHRGSTEEDWDMVQSLRCPIDEVDILFDEAFSDNFLMREVLDLNVRCLEHGHGCPWKGFLRHLEQHSQDCGFVDIHCECGMTVRRCDLDNHSQNECKARLQPCTYCTERIKLNMMEVHQSTECPAFSIACPKCNKPNIIRSELKRHYDPQLGTCEEAENLCSFLDFGCDKKEPMKRHEWLQHADDYSQRHLRLVAEFIQHLATQEKVDSNNEESKNKLESLTEAVRSLEVHTRQLQQQTADEDQNLLPTLSFRFHEGRDPNMNDVVHTIKCCIGKLQQLQQNSNALGRQGERRDAATGELERRVAELEDRQVHSAMQFAAAPEYPGRLEQEVDRHLSQRVRSEHRGRAGADFPGIRQQSRYNGTLQWKIDGYARAREAAIRERKTSFHSPFFYTSEHGYKMRTRIHLNGVDSGKGTHISVFFVIMRGSFDEELRWPFRQKVTITLWDHDKAKHVTKVFTPDPNSSSFQKPRMEMNVASGCPQFCSLVELSEHAYVRDDVMFIKVVVDTSGL